MTSDKMTITEILKNKEANRPSLLAKLRQNIQKNTGAYVSYEKDDIEYIIDVLRNKEDDVARELWGIVYLLPANDLIIDYCRGILDKCNTHKYDNGREFELTYLLSNEERQSELLEKWLNSEDVYMKHAAQEALVRYDMPRALRLMLDLYESLEFEHDLIDSILNWIAYEGDLETVQYLENKIAKAKNEFDRTTYIQMRENIISKHKLY